MSFNIFFASLCCYLDDSNGAAVASRALVELLARKGFDVEVLSGLRFDVDREVDVDALLAEKGIGKLDPTFSYSISHDRLIFHGVPITLHRTTSTRPREADERERAEFLALLEEAFERFRPDVLIGYGGDRLAREVFERARKRGIKTVFTLHNFHYLHPAPFEHVDAVIVPSHFAAQYYQDALGLECDVLPYPIDWNRAKVERVEPKFVVFLNPILEKGVFAFAKIADELGRTRPDIPFLVVESRGTEADLASCGLDLRAHGNVHLMPATSDPKSFWRVARMCLLPSFWLENQPLTAVEAMLNGIPVIGSDRGGIPETFGNAGIVLPLPARLTPNTRLLPDTEEVAPWVDTIVRLWDDEAFYREHRRRSFVEAERWNSANVEEKYVRFLKTLRAGRSPGRVVPASRSKSVVLVPHLSGIIAECEASLRELEREGVRVIRSEGSSQIDVARNMLASDALHDGYDSIFFIDADIGFEPRDPLRLLARPEPVLCGVYSKKGSRELTSRFDRNVKSVEFGETGGLYPLRHAAGGFLRVKASVFVRLIEELRMPLCNARWSRGFWPFFQPMIVPLDDGDHHYLGEDWSFSERLAQIGVVPLADTTIRLWHYGRFPFGWEDAGADPRPRAARFSYELFGE